MSTAPPVNLTFRRPLTGNKWNRWIHLLSRLIEVQLSNEKDVFSCDLKSSSRFTVKSLYLDFMSGYVSCHQRFIWKKKVPLKIKIFMWFLYRKVILTKDNLTRRNWHGCKKCCFCDQDETIQHLFITCPLACMVWRIVYLAFNIRPLLTLQTCLGIG